MQWICTKPSINVENGEGVKCVQVFGISNTYLFLFKDERMIKILVQYSSCLFGVATGMVDFPLFSIGIYCMGNVLI